MRVVQRNREVQGRKMEGVPFLSRDVDRASVTEEGVCTRGASEEMP